MQEKNLRLFHTGSVVLTFSLHILLTERSGDSSARLFPSERKMSFFCSHNLPDGSFLERYVEYVPRKQMCKRRKMRVKGKKTTVIFRDPRKSKRQKKKSKEKTKE
jgi:hypothetical protein